MRVNEIITINKQYLNDLFYVKIGGNLLTAIIAEPFSPTPGLECLLVVRDSDNLYLMGMQDGKLRYVNTYTGKRKIIEVKLLEPAFIKFSNEEEVKYYTSLFDDKGYNPKTNSWI